MNAGTEMGHENRASQSAHGAPAVVAHSGLAFFAGAFFSFRMFIMLLTVRLFDMEPQIGTGISLAFDYLLLLLVCLDLIGKGSPRVATLQNVPPVRWVAVFLAFSCLSLSWTVADSQFAAVGYWCSLAADVAIVALFSFSPESIENIHAFMRGYVWGACLLAFIAWFLPTQSDLRLGDEDLLGANQIGYLCGFAFFIAQYLIGEKLGKFGVGATLLAVTMLRSLSKTTIAAFLIAEAFFLWKDSTIARKKKIWILLAVCLVCVLFSGLLFSYADQYASEGNNPETLTGRLSIWAVILEEAISMPYMGHGFYSVWKVIPPFGTFEARHAHNELLQQFYLYGVTGLTLISALYGSFYLHTRRLVDNRLKCFFTALMIFVLIRGFADTEVYDFSLPLWAIVAFSVLLRERGLLADRKRSASRNARTAVNVPALS